MTDSIADLANLTAQVGTAPEDRADYTVEQATASDLACETCGKDIAHLYSGRGRKPKACEEHKRGRSGASRIGSSAGSVPRGEVAQAVASLEQAYSLVQMGLVLMGAHTAAASLRDSIPGLSTSNAQYLATDKDMVKQINRVGKVGGKAGFFANQALVFGPVALLAAQELAAKRAEKVPAETPFSAFAEADA